MLLFRFNRHRIRAFLWWLLIFAVPPACMLIPLLYVLGLPVIVLWITIPAALFSATGLRSYEFAEFGALPHGPMDWGMIALFYLVAAFLLSLVGRPARA